MDKFQHVGDIKIQQGLYNIPADTHIQRVVYIISG